MGSPAARGHHSSLQAEAGCSTGSPFLAAPITEAHAQRKTGAGVADILWWSGEKSPVRVGENTNRDQKTVCLSNGRRISYRSRGKNPLAVGGNFTLKWR